jgi:hypothetical protein
MRGEGLVAGWLGMVASDCGGKGGWWWWRNKANIDRDAVDVGLKL